jgi:hypothetical protein
MKRLLFLLVLLSALGFAQTSNPGVRFGDGEPAWQAQSVTGYTPLFTAVQGNATINFCNYPANGSPCTNLAQTFSDASMSNACPLNQQVVLNGTTSCVSTTDSAGRWGVWAPAGQYAYTITWNGSSFGPFFATLGGSSGGGSVIVPGAINDILSSNGASGFQVDSGIFYYDPTGHVLHSYGYQSDSTLPFLLTMLPNASPCTAGPTGKTQLCAGPGSALFSSYGGDGPFQNSRWGNIGTALQLPASSFYPLDANSALPLGMLGDVCLVRVAAGVMGVINCASLSSPSKLIAAYECYTSNCRYGGVNWNASAGAVQFFGGKSGSANYPQMQFCPFDTTPCDGWGILGGASASVGGAIFPLSGNLNPDIGSPSQGQVRNIFQQGALVESGQYALSCTNDATGTQIGLIAKRGATTDANGNLECEISTTSDTTGLVGVVVGESSGGTCGQGSNCTTGVAYVAFRGHYAATFDGTTTLKHWAIASTSTAANFSDSGIACANTPPGGVDLLGCIAASNTGAGTYEIDLNVIPARNLIASCGTTTTCAGATVSGFKEYYGRVALSSGSPSTAVITALGFTSSSTYQCVATNSTTAANGIKVTYSSGSSATFTGPNTVTDSVSYDCKGN